MFSYEVALGLSFVTLIMVAGSFRIRDIVDSQAGWIWHWNPIRQLPAFAVFLVAATAEANRTPFHLPVPQTVPVAGFLPGLSSHPFRRLQIAQHINLLTPSALIP